MRKHIWILVLLSVMGLELVAPQTARAQPWSTGDSTVVDTYDTKRVRRKRQIYGLVGFAVIAVVGGCFILMNSIDRRAARRRQEERMREKAEQGLL
jgi:hypothetical protein